MRSGPASRSAPRTTLTRPAPDSTTNTSPLGAVRIMRGSLTLVVSRSTTNPAGTRGRAPDGRRTIVAPLSADGVAYGAGRSSGVSLRRTPGASVVHSPIAARPVSTAGAGGSGGGAPAASVDASTPAIAGARESADRMSVLYRESSTGVPHAVPEDRAARSRRQDAVILEQPADPVERQRLRRAARAAHGLGAKQRIDDRLLGGVGDRLEQRVERVIGDRRLVRGRERD